MGQTDSKYSVQQQYDILRANEDGSALLRHRKTNQQYLLRSICSNIAEQINGFQDLLKKRQIVKCPHLLDIVQIRRKQEKNVCSVAHKLYMLIEYPFRTLKDEIVDKSNRGKLDYFQEAQLWSILYSCCVALSTLYQRKMPHESLTNKQIFISKDGIIKISDPLLLGLQKNYIKLLKKQHEQNVHVSPQIMNFLDDCNFSYYDKQKSDIFILGNILLQASVLRSICLFQKQTKKPLFENIPKALKQVRSRYSKNYAQLLQKMLHINSKPRPKFDQIIDLIEQDTNLYQDPRHYTSLCKLPTDEQDSVYNKKQNNYKATNMTSISKGLIPKKPSSRPQNQQQQRFKEQYDKTKPKQPQTLIKMLNTQKLDTLNPYYRQSITHPFNYNNYYKQFQNNYTVQQSSNLHIQKPGSSLPTYYDMNQGPYPNYGISNPIYQNSTPNPQVLYQHNPQFMNLNRHVPTDDRFSINKFGNIQLNTRQTQKVIYSQDIPYINQIMIKNQQDFVYACNRVQSPHVMHPNQFQSNISQNQSFTQQFRSNQTIGSHLGSPMQAPAPPTVSTPTVLPNLNIHNPNPTFQNINNFMFNRNTQISGSHQLNLNAIQSKPSKQLKVQGNIQKGKVITKQNIVSAGEFSYKVQPCVEQSKKVERNKRGQSKLKQVQKSPQTTNKIPIQKESGHPNVVNNQKNPQEQSQTKFVILALEGGGKYEGFIKNGKKNGQGKLQFNDGGYYEGEWKNNKMNGFGKLYYQNGNVAYQGNWVGDEFEGKGIVYNDRPQKLDTPFNYHDFAQLGDMWLCYQGQFKQDSKHGQGIIRLTNGEVFQGTFCFDYVEGQGVFYTMNKQAIKGIWKDNMLISS